MAVKIDSDGNRVISYPEILGSFVKKRRIELNLSQDELARRVGYDSENSRATIGKIEAGKQDITVTRVKELAKALDIDVEFLVTLDRAPSAGEQAYSKIIQYADVLDKEALERLSAYFKVLAEKEDL